MATVTDARVPMIEMARDKQNLRVIALLKSIDQAGRQHRRRLRASPHSELYRFSLCSPHQQKK